MTTDYCQTIVCANREIVGRRRGLPRHVSLVLPSHGILCARIPRSLYFQYLRHTPRRDFTDCAKFAAWSRGWPPGRTPRKMVNAGKLLNGGLNRVPLPELPPPRCRGRTRTLRRI